MKLPDYPIKGKSVEQTVREIIDYLRMTTITNFQGGQMKQSRGGTTLSVAIDQRHKMPDLPYDPFYPTLTGNESDGLLLSMRNGYVILRKKSGDDAMGHIVPSDLPNETEVVVGDKFTLKIEEDTLGNFTTAAIVKTSGSWPTSTAPDLDATTTSGGLRHIRLCEIVKETDFPAVKIWSTGHVDHFAPTILESESGGADVLKGFADGKWLLRALTAGAGITITENASTIGIASDTVNGWWGTVSWLFVPAGGGGSSQNLILAFEAGILKTVTLDGTSISGTEATPGDAELEVNF